MGDPYASLAKAERERISERTRAGLARVKRSGRKLGRTPVASKKRDEAFKLVKGGMKIRAAARKLCIPLHSAPDSDAFGTPIGAERRWVFITYTIVPSDQSSFPLFPHGFSLQIDLVSIMHEAVQDGIGEGRVHHDIMPVFNR